MKARLALLFVLLILVSCAPAEEPVEEAIVEEPVEVEEEVGCMDNLERFDGTYDISLLSRELGIVDYATEGAIICGAGDDFFGDFPSSVTLVVENGVATITVGPQTYTGTFEGPSAPKKPLVSDRFYEDVTARPTGVNSCGAESPYFSFTDAFAEDDGQTTLQVWVYAQEDAVYVVEESFWIADETQILSQCHGVAVLEGLRA